MDDELYDFSSPKICDLPCYFDMLKRHWNAINLTKLSLFLRGFDSFLTLQFDWSEDSLDFSISISKFSSSSSMLLFWWILPLLEEISLTNVSYLHSIHFRLNKFFRLSRAMCNQNINKSRSQAWFSRSMETVQFIHFSKIKSSLQTQPKSNLRMSLNAIVLVWSKIDSINSTF